MGGFAVVLALLVIVAAVSLINLSSVIEDVGIADTSGQIATDMHQASQAATKVVFRGTEQARNQVKMHVDNARATIGKVTGRLQRNVQKESLNKVLKDLDHFQTAFNHYLTLDGQKRQAMATMEASSREAMDQVTGLRETQQTQVTTTRQQTTDVINRCLANATDAAQLARLVSMARVQEKSFLNSNGNVTWSQSHTVTMEKILAVAVNLKARLDDPAAIQQINAVIEAIDSYQTTFAAVVKKLKQQQQTVAQMDAGAREAVVAMQALREDQKQLLMDTRLESDTRIVTALSLTEEINIVMQMLMVVREWHSKVVYEGINGNLAGWEKALKRITGKLANLKWLVTSETDQQRLSGLVKSIKTYSKKLQAYAVDHSTVSEDDLAKAEALPFELIDEMRRGFADQLHIIQRQTNFTMENKMNLAETGNVLITELLKLRRIEGRYLMSQDDRQWKTQFSEVQADIVKQAEEMTASLDDGAGRQNAAAFLDLVTTYGDQFDQVCTILAMRQTAVISMESAADTALSMTEAFFAAQTDQLIKAQTAGSRIIGKLMDRSAAANDLLKLIMTVRLGEKQLLLSRDVEQARANEDGLNELLAASQSLYASLTKQDDLSRMDLVLERVRQYGQALASTAELIVAQETAEPKMIAAADTAQLESQALRKTQANNLFASMSNAKTIVLIGTIVAIGLAVAIAILLTRSITSPLRRAVGGLNTAAAQVTAVAGQMASTGQALASGASQQAADIESASASLGEIASMSRESASNAGKADDMVKATSQVVVRARQSMGGVTESITAIDTASRETS